ncbi:MAG: hypothetical protein NUV60_01045 [Patescibacteria group bacterium]|nr:hypothetical protein [Patescibacteria group bacterium]
MLIPYVGITDFMNFQQVQAMLRIFKVHQRPDSKRKLHVGVMMSYKTLHGIPSSWDKAFPSKETIADIFSSAETYNCLHIADYDSMPHLGRKTLAPALQYAGDLVHAVQLDMIWPHPSQILLGIHTSRKNPEVILQVGRKALTAVKDDPLLLVEKLREYEGGVIQRVLLDKSGGEGRAMEADVLLPFVRAIRENLPELDIVVAGGLGPYTMHLAEPIIREFPDVSIDAQGRLRPSRNALDPVDWHMAGGYLATALELLEWR